MLKRKLIYFCVAFCLASYAHAQQKLLILCSITLVPPIEELAKIFETREGVQIQIAQGGAKDMIQSAKKSHVGDLYFPSSPSFMFDNETAGLFGSRKIVGYSQIALIVQKGNPKHIKGNLKELLRKDISVTLGSIGSGSIGYESKKILESQKIYKRVIQKVVSQMPDSRVGCCRFRRHESKRVSFPQTLSG